MKRNYYINDLNLNNFQNLAIQVAYNEAGHAAAIYLYNKQHQLPPIFFQIHLKNYDEIKQLKTEEKNTQSEHIAAAIEGGS